MTLTQLLFSWLAPRPAPGRRRPAARSAPDGTVTTTRAPGIGTAAARNGTRGKGAQQARYDELVRTMKREYGIRIHKWRSSTSGCAWEVHGRDGSFTRLIEAPYPKGPMSCAVFMHEVGHHAIGFGRYRPRCLEEYHAWAWALTEMRARGFNVTERVEQRMADALEYALYKALKRGMRRLPVELEPFVTARLARTMGLPHPRPTSDQGD